MVTLVLQWPLMAPPRLPFSSYGFDLNVKWEGGVQQQALCSALQSLNCRSSSFHIVSPFAVAESNREVHNKSV